MPSPYLTAEAVRVRCEKTVPEFARRVETGLSRLDDLPVTLRSVVRTLIETGELDVRPLLF